MRSLKISLFLSLMISALFSTTQDSSKSSLQEEIVAYQCDSTTMMGFIVFNKTVHRKRPVVLVVPKWWGLTD